MNLPALARRHGLQAERTQTGWRITRNGTLLASALRPNEAAELIQSHV